MQITLNKTQMAGLNQGNLGEKSILKLYGQGPAFNLNDKTVQAILTDPDYVSQVTFVNDFTFYDLKLSFKGDACVAITRNQDQYELNSDVDFESIFLGLQMYTGNSILMSTDLNLELTMEEANLFTAILDAMRAKRNLIGQLPVTFKPEDLKDFSDNENCITPYVSRLTGTQDRGELSTLVEKKLIKPVPEGYEINESMKNLLHVFTQLDNYIEVSAMANVMTSFTALQSGLHTILLFEVGHQHIKIRSLSPAVFMEIMVEVLMKNERLMAIPSKATPVADDTPRNFCSNCGMKLKEDAKFCAGCGTKI